jgi:hypothetical protein
MSVLFQLISLGLSPLLSAPAHPPLPIDLIAGEYSTAFIESQPCMPRQRSLGIEVPQLSLVFGHHARTGPLSKNDTFVGLEVSARFGYMNRSYAPQVCPAFSDVFGGGA